MKMLRNIIARSFDNYIVNYVWVLQMINQFFVYFISKFINIYKIEIKTKLTTSILSFSFENEMNSNWSDKYFWEMIRNGISHDISYDKQRDKHKLTNSCILLSFKILIRNIFLNWYNIRILSVVSTRGDWKRAVHARGVINNKRAQQSPSPST